MILRSVLLSISVALACTGAASGQSAASDSSGMPCCATGNESAPAAMSCCRAASSASQSGGCCSTGEGSKRKRAAKTADHAQHATPGSGHERVAAQEDSGARSGHGAAGQERGRHGARGHGGMGSGRSVMPDAMALLRNHSSIERTWEEVAGGIRSRTTSTDPDLVELVRRHPREMYAHYENGGAVRPHDPMFGELGRVSDKIDMEFRDIEGGIEVTVTSDDAEVRKLIRAHAAKVSDFVKRGMPAWHEGGQLPPDYVRPEN